MVVGKDACLWVGVVGCGQVLADIGKEGKGGQVWMAQRLIRRELVTWLVVGRRYACRSRLWDGWWWVTLGRYGQDWAKVARSG